ncbi:MAG: glycosyltransferase [Elusimicrobiota bacterium]
MREVNEGGPSGTKTLLVLCSGLGLGNSTRLLGVAQALRFKFKIAPEALRIIVCTSGRAVEFWATEGRPVQAQVVALEPYQAMLDSAGSRIDWLGLIRPASAGIYLRNCRKISSFIKNNVIDLALIDSDYHCLPLLFEGIPIFILGQARDVLKRYIQYGIRARVPLRSMAIELLDYLFQRFIGERILVPSFEPNPPAGKSVLDVPLIVRQEFEKVSDNSAQGPAHVLLSGSNIGSEPLLIDAKRHGLPVIGTSGETSALDARGLPRIDHSAAVIAQGGLSSISECLARKKQMILLPIEGHGEQMMNALEIQRRGAGICALKLRQSPSSLLERLSEMCGSAPNIRWPAVNGAGIVAEILLRRLRLSSGAESTSRFKALE